MAGEITALQTSLGEAIKIAIDIESTAGETHYRTAMEQSNKDLSDFLKHLSTSDKEHSSALKEFAKRRGIEATFQSRL